MGNRFLKWAAVLSSVALLSGALVVTANAHIGSSHSQVSTDGPDLVSATATSDDTADFCFDEEVTSVESETSFNLWGYDSEYRFDSDSAEESSDDENCVEVTFSGIDTDADIRETTVAQVDADAVEDAAGEANTIGAVALGGSTLEGGPGRTTAPNLIEVTSDASTATYVFDQLLDCSLLTDTEANAENFGYYDDDGNIFYGDSVNECDDNEVEVGFTDAGDVDDEAARFFVAKDQNSDAAADDDEADAVNPTANAVCQPDSDGATGACTSFETDDGDVEDRPDLTDADRTDEDQWTYSFDDDIDDDPITDVSFHIYEEDGSEKDAASAACTEEDDSNVECTFAETGDDVDIEEAEDHEFPLAAVEHCGAEDASTTVYSCATYGDAPVADSQIQSGSTDGPDLETVTLNATDELADFCFDENVDDTDANVDDDEFFLLEADGDRTTAGSSTVDDVNDNCVTVEFDEEDITAAVAGGVDADAVQDWLGNDNVPASAGTVVTNSGTPRTSTATATTTVVTTSSSTPPQTTTVTTDRSPTPRKIRTATTLTIRYDRDANSFRGAAASRKRNCQRGRLVTLKKHTPGPNRSVGTDTTNRAGNWKIRKRVRRGRFYAVVAKKRYTDRRGNTVVCLRDKSVTIKV